MQDKKLICRDCGAEFFFTAGEQGFYREQGFENEPRPQCRGLKKRQSGGRDQSLQAIYMDGRRDEK